MSRVAFVSYCRQDHAHVETLKDRMTQLGFEVWLDKNLRGGQEWWNVILDKIASCEVFIMIISDASLDSRACTLEREYARALRKPIIPVAIAVTRVPMPSDIQTLQIVDYSTPTEDAAFALVSALNSHERDFPLPDPLPAPPEPPLSYLNRQMDVVLARESLSHDEQVGVLMTVRPGLRSTDLDEQVSAWKVLEALDARADVSREASEEIARLRIYHGPAAVTAPAQPSRNHTTQAHMDPPESLPAPRTPSTPGPANPLLPTGAAIGVGLLFTLATAWVSALALGQWPGWAPPWLADALHGLLNLQSVLLLPCLALMVYVGMVRARARPPSSPSTAANVTLHAALHSIPLVLLWTMWAAAVNASPASGLVIASQCAATTVGVVAQMLRQLSQAPQQAERTPA